jgi:serine/threonine protein kinase
MTLLWLRDIKPENLLLMKQPGVASTSPEGLVLKVVDYGCSTFCVPNKRLCKKFGTVRRAADCIQLLHPEPALIRVATWLVKGHGPRSRAAILQCIHLPISASHPSSSSSSS